MKFSIITPAFNQLSYLKRCVASIADQKGVDVEHIVIDGGSTDGTVEWLMETTSQQIAGNYHLAFVSEADEGMYDALNKGFSQASGDIFAWLNCDEQYLPETLATVSGFFGGRPEIDLLNGDALVVDPSGNLMGFWKCMPLRRRYLESSYLYNLSCAMFFRKHVFSPDSCFDISFKTTSDQEFVASLLRKGVTPAAINTYFSAYTFTSDNLSEQDFAKAERTRLRVTKQNGWCRSVLRIMQKSERLLRGCRIQKFPLEYALYVDDTRSRRYFKSNRVPACWPGLRNTYG